MEPHHPLQGRELSMCREISEPIDLKFGMIDYVRHLTPHAKIGSRRKRGVGWGYG